jgi:hypothetical protein
VSLYAVMLGLHSALGSLHSVMENLHGAMMSLHGAMMSLHGAMMSLHGATEIPSATGLCGPTMSFLLGEHPQGRGEPLKPLRGIQYFSFQCKKGKNQSTLMYNNILIILHL